MNVKQLQLKSRGYVSGGGETGREVLENSTINCLSTRQVF